MMNQDIDQKVTYCLEMTSRKDLRPSRRTTTEYEVKRVEIACPEFNWFLFETVGAEFRWGGREDWDRQKWAEYVDRPELETWVAYVLGTPAGYYELEIENDSSVQIKTFGLQRQFFGQGLGGALLTKAVKRCWEVGANRVWLTTCTHDHPQALQNYLARGFKLVSETTGPANPPRKSGLFTHHLPP